MKKEKKKLSQKEIENIKLKRKKTIAKIVNIFVWVYAIGVSLLLVVGSACSRSYSGASAETIEYDNDKILLDYSNYDPSIEYRFYWSDDKLKQLKKSASITTTIYRVPSIQWFYDMPDNGNYNLRILGTNDITQHDKLHIVDDKYLIGVRTDKWTRTNDILFTCSYIAFDSVSGVYSYVTFLQYSLSSGSQINGVPVNILGGYYDLNYFNAFVELMSGKYVINTDFTLDLSNNSRFGILGLALFSQYSIQNINVHFTEKYYRLQISYDRYLSLPVGGYDAILHGYKSPIPFYNLNYSDLLFAYNDYQVINNFVIKIENYSYDFKDYLIDSGVYYYDGVYYDSIYIKYYHLAQGESFYYTKGNNVGDLGTYLDTQSYIAVSNYEYVPLCIYLYHNTGTQNLGNDILPIFNFCDFDYKVNDGLNVSYWQNINNYINFDIPSINFNLYFHKLGFNNVSSVYYTFFKYYLSLDSSFQFVVKDNGVHINDGSINIYSPYSTTFDLINIGFGGIISLMGFYILPGISIGALLMVPMVLTLVLVVVKLFKR